NARHGVRLHEHRGHPWRNRSDEYVGHTGGSGPNQYDLVAVFFCWDLPAVDVEERVRWKRWSRLGVLVEVRVHLQLGIGPYAQTSEADALAGYGLDVRGTQIQAARRDLQRHRGIVLIVVRQNERLGTDRAVYIGWRIEVTQGGNGSAERFDHR